MGKMGVRIVILTLIYLRKEVKRAKDGHVKWEMILGSDMEDIYNETGH